VVVLRSRAAAEIPVRGARLVRSVSPPRFLALERRSGEGAHLDAIHPRHHDAFMRTTLTLDDDVARMLDEEAHKQRRPFKQVVNDALRRGLSSKRARTPAARYRVRPHAAKLQPGIDPGRLNALVDEIEIGEGAARAARPAS
jgi:hypothetical protein